MIASGDPIFPSASAVYARTSVTSSFKSLTKTETAPSEVVSLKASAALIRTP